MPRVSARRGRQRPPKVRSPCGGRAQFAIAKGLQRDDVRTLTRASWYATTVSEILRNPLYIGQITFNGGRRPGERTPIVDPRVWENARQLREARSAQGRPRGRRTAGRHLLTEGLLRCTCGAAMSPVTKPSYEVYTCLKRLHYARKPARRRC